MSYSGISTNDYNGIVESLLKYECEPHINLTGDHQCPCCQWDSKTKYNGWNSRSIIIQPKITRIQYEEIINAAPRFLVFPGIIVSSESTVEHINIRCDGCNSKPIIGDRFHRLECEDFDLCSKCFSQTDTACHAADDKVSHKFALLKSSIW